MNRFKDFKEFSAHLDGLGLFRMDLTLGRMQAFARALSPAPNRAAVQVVGTNGKGSTATFLAAVAQAHGLRTGLYTSPHLARFRERLLLDGEMLSEQDWTDLANALERSAPGLDLTYFELLTALAALAFGQAGTELAVYEAGLGGTWDATTALPVDLTLFTPMGLDHEAILGPGLACIARDKAGAMRPNGLAVTGPQEPEVLEILADRAREIGAELHHAADLAELPLANNLGLSGPHQQENARLALAAWRLVARKRGWKADAQAETRGLARAFIPGRLQSVDFDPPLLLDGAHNEPALIALARALDALGLRPAGLIFACLKDKDLPAMLPLVQGLTDGPILVPELPGNERALSAQDLAGRLGPRARAVPDLDAALNLLAGSKGRVLLCGSLYLLAEFYTKHPRFLTRPAT